MFVLFKKKREKDLYQQLRQATSQVGLNEGMLRCHSYLGTRNLFNSYKSVEPIVEFMLS